MKKTAVLAIALFTGSAAMAQDQAAPAANAALEACRAIEKDNRRLECYDAAMDALYGVDEELVTQREQVREDRFGLQSSENSLEPDSIEATISEVAADVRTGSVIVALDNGQIWDTTSNGSIKWRLKVGQRVTIAPGPFSGYRLRIEGVTGYQGVRRQK
ncbi:hypothetical protein [Qipengyuania zhejiangensis]|uniref:hypothetical protein n=1 Tax=Qipengyuania zhejiangensis TaxID=3077782 RepID=UPI002D767DD3|nr:hypothetical protein [Qipengyuania sp. Z2]